MSQMIKCDGCNSLMYADSRSEKDDFHEIWIDRESQFHLCKKCHIAFMEKILHRVWDEDEAQWIPEEE